MKQTRFTGRKATTTSIASVANGAAVISLSGEFSGGLVIVAFRSTWLFTTVSGGVTLATGISLDGVQLDTPEVEQLNVSGSVIQQTPWHGRVPPGVHTISGILSSAAYPITFQGGTLFATEVG